MEKLVFEAAAEGNVASLSSVLEEDPLILDRIIANCFSETPLHVAAMLGHVHVVEEIVRRKHELTRELNSNGSTPLHLASANGYANIVRALLLVDPDTCLVRDKDGRTPLHLAAIKGRFEIFKDLYEAKPEAAKANICRRGNILHLCLLHNQLEVLKFLAGKFEDQEFLNSRDDQGNSILHLAVADKQVETINYLVSSTEIEVNAENMYGLTALDVLIQSRRDVKDMEIRESLSQAGASSGKFKETSRKATNTNPQRKNTNELIEEQDWLERKRNVLMIVASLIATMAFQVGVNPPGGYWQETSKMTIKSGEQVYVQIGHSIWADNEPESYALFILLNTTGFIASLSIILLLISGLPIRRKRFIWILMVIMWVAITTLAFTYIICVAGITNWNDERGPVLFVLALVILVWIGLMSLLLLGHSIRLIVRGVKALRNRGFEGTTFFSKIRSLQGFGYGNKLPA